MDKIQLMVEEQRKLIDEQKELSDPTERNLYQKIIEHMEVEIREELRTHGCSCQGQYDECETCWGF